LAAAAREHVVGWYSTGPRLREADLAIHQLMSNYVTTPVLVICEVEVRQK
jgi:26S proteasome regulatory subunit N8